jgi:hypothetical protein
MVCVVERKKKKGIRKVALTPKVKLQISFAPSASQLFHHHFVMPVNCRGDGPARHHNLFVLRAVRPFVSWTAYRLPTSFKNTRQRNDHQQGIASHV